jgi:hypothetical protein
MHSVVTSPSTSIDGWAQGSMRTVGHVFINYGAQVRSEQRAFTLSVRDHLMPNINVFCYTRSLWPHSILTLRCCTHGATGSWRATSPSRRTPCLCLMVRVSAPQSHSHTQHVRVYTRIRTRAHARFNNLSALQFPWATHGKPATGLHRSDRPTLFCPLPIYRRAHHAAYQRATAAVS